MTLSTSRTTTERAKVGSVKMSTSLMGLTTIRRNFVSPISGLHQGMILGKAKDGGGMGSWPGALATRAHIEGFVRTWSTLFGLDPAGYPRQLRQRASPEK